MARSLMFLGTGSDVGKSIAVTAFCRLFKRLGFRVAPFKAQNMSNNSYVTLEGGEIGRAQAVQAEAAGLVPSVHMNPVLLKPSSGQAAQVIVHGNVISQVNVRGGDDFRPVLKSAIMESYHILAEYYDIIIIEGAGSCCEMNLKEKDIVNFHMAKKAKAKCVLVADIDRGGVFAQILGTFGLMSRGEKEMTRGILINKFRGDPNLFASGLRYIESRAKRPVLGLIPFLEDIQIDAEDAVAVQADLRPLRPVGTKTLNIAVVRMPAISNFTDMEVLEREPGVVLNYLSRPEGFSRDYDLLVLPGTKNVMEDADWLARSGWKDAVRGYAEAGGHILGICGGYQLLGQKIMDPDGVESKRKFTSGLGLLPLETSLEKKKVVRKVSGLCLINGKRIKGYEIHMGRSTIKSAMGKPYLRINRPGSRESWYDGWSTGDGRISGTYVHGIFDFPGFREEFLNTLRRKKGIENRPSKRAGKSHSSPYDRLADHFEKYCDVKKIIGDMQGDGRESLT